MKNVFLFFALIVCSNVWAQRDYVDSSYVKWDVGSWFRVNIRQYTNGENDISQRIIGDSITLFNQSVESVVNITAAHANDIATVSEYPRDNRNLIKWNDDIVLKLGKSPLDTLEDRNSGQFLVPGWTVKNDGGTFPIVFNKTAAKKLRAQYNGQTTNKNCDLFSNHLIRIRDFPTAGLITEFYRLPNGRRWVNSDGSQKLIPPGGNAGNR